MGIDSHLEIDYRMLSLEIGDVFMMITDGIHDYLSESQLKQRLQLSTTLQQQSDAIVANALDAGSLDNVTCQLLRIESLPGQLPDEAYNELTRLPFPPHLEPGMSIDGYEILAEIHASARSQHYRVRDVDSGRLYVMKTPSITFEYDPAYIERFYIEEWAGKRTNSDHVLRIYEPLRPRHFLYFIMEHIDGITLRQWIDGHPMPDIKEVTDMIARIIPGLRIFHRMEMLHRDLKPDNIMITRKGDVKIVDFGSVKIAGIEEISSPVERLDLLGTKNYTAPEYLRGMESSHYADLFSLGVICYEMLTGQLSYGDQQTQNLNWRRLNKIEYNSAIVHNPMIPLWIDGALSKAVSLEQQLRYDTFSEFLYDLTHPNSAFMKRSYPLLEKHRYSIWKLLATASFVINLTFDYLNWH